MSLVENWGFLLSIVLRNAGRSMLKMSRCGLMRFDVLRLVFSKQCVLISRAMHAYRLSGPLFKTASSLRPLKRPVLLLAAATFENSTTGERTTSNGGLMTTSASKSHTLPTPHISTTTATTPPSEFQENLGHTEIKSKRTYIQKLLATAEQTRWAAIYHVSHESRARSTLGRHFTLVRSARL